MRTRSALIAVALLCACALPGANASDHDHDYHEPAACREFGYPEAGWQLDADCCAPSRQSACANGYDHEVTDRVCYKSGDCVAYSTRCIRRNSETVTMFDAENYECEPDVTGLVITIIFAIVVPLLVTGGILGCYFTKTCCFHYRRARQFGSIPVAPGVQMGGMTTVYMRPVYVGAQVAGPPQHYGQQPAPTPGYTVHQATVQPMQTPHAQPSGQPYTGQGSQDPGVVRYGQNKVPTV